MVGPSAPCGGFLFSRDRILVLCSHKGSEHEYQNAKAADAFAPIEMMDISHISGCRRVCPDLPLAELRVASGSEGLPASHTG